MLEASLRWDGYFPRAGVGGNAFDFLRLLQNEPEAAKAVEAVYRDTKWSQAELYSVTVGKKPHRFVFGSESRGSNTKELFYPEHIDGAVENHLLLNALLKAKCSLLRFLWQEEGGVVLLCLYPPFGFFVAAFGWMLSGTATLQSPMPVLGVLVSLAMAAFGVAVFLFPFAYSWRRRNRLRSALKKYSLSGIKEELKKMRVREQKLA